MNQIADIRHVLDILKNKFYIIVICISLCIATIDGATYMLVKPTYKASTEVLIEQSQGNENQRVQDDQTSTQLLNTYLVIIKSASITESVSQNLTFEITPKQVSSSLTVENASGSKIISIIAKADSPQKATEIVNKTTEELKTKAPTILKNSSVVVLEKAKSENNLTPVSPNFKTTTVLGFFAGIFTGVFMIYLSQLLNARIRRKEDIEELSQYPFLGKVSQVK
ncbi:hypothetical protein HCA78_14315 [Listeria booriae]|uniref:Polysaccharide chain length determinant N-terminal domain-containing protein n=1 Tax=Listeria booriae TaxID=1552123 RepID=A0A842CV63_9LIST|nr:Wzz/FepE/Etk N-terminal domain-containing protein [Listeria booriae]MBC2004956.1 hypothetical protein [Listeria booriae]MBC2025003.1 hypothetical protein [Listeria booriae]